MNAVASNERRTPNVPAVTVLTESEWTLLVCVLDVVELVVLGELLLLAAPPREDGSLLELPIPP